MARVLFAWELGGGLGHIIPHLGLIDQLRQRGHEIVFAVRDTAHVGKLLFARGVRCLQSPVRLQPVARPVDPACTYADILYNSGFDDPDALRGRIEAWRSLFEFVRPSLAVFDHSPTALLAARAFSFSKAIVGTGFVVPPDVSPLPNLRVSRSVDVGILHGREQNVLNVMNEVLGLAKLPILDRVTQLFTGNLIALSTFSELDHYPDRVGATYWGCATQPQGEPPAWPSVSGKRIFAYLKPVPGLAKLLALLQSLEQPTLVYVDRLDPALKAQFKSSALAFSDTPVDMRAVAGQCDFAVHHAGHGTTVDLLLAARPVLQLPITLENQLLAHRVEQLGAGVTVDRPSLRATEQGLKRMLEHGSKFGERAKSFAARYAGLDSQTQQVRLADQLCEHLS